MQNFIKRIVLKQNVMYLVSYQKTKRFKIIHLFSSKMRITDKFIN